MRVASMARSQGSRQGTAGPAGAGLPGPCPGRAAGAGCRFPAPGPRGRVAAGGGMHRMACAHLVGCLLAALLLGGACLHAEEDAAARAALQAKVGAVKLLGLLHARHWVGPVAAGVWRHGAGCGEVHAAATCGPALHLAAQVSGLVADVTSKMDAQVWPLNLFFPSRGNPLGIVHWGLSLRWLVPALR